MHLKDISKLANFSVAILIVKMKEKSNILACDVLLFKKGKRTNECQN